MDRFAHLSQARWVALLSQPTVTLRGAECNALVGVPSNQGPFSRLFTWMVAQLCATVCDWEEPDFLILLDAAIWPSLDAVRKERLIYHELCHVVARENEYGVPRLDAEGRPMLKLVPHDAEFFHDEVARYGPEICSLEDACIALAEGARGERVRNTPAA